MTEYQVNDICTFLYAGTLSHSPNLILKEVGNEVFLCIQEDKTALMNIQSLPCSAFIKHNSAGLECLPVSPSQACPSVQHTQESRKIEAWGQVGLDLTLSSTMC